nr:hypothetical protein Itr_chr02CG11600 [Ipomoea trifida]
MPRLSTSGTSILHKPLDFFLKPAIKSAKTKVFAVRTWELSSNTKLPPPFLPFRFSLTSKIPKLPPSLTALSSEETSHSRGIGDLAISMEAEGEWPRPRSVGFGASSVSSRESMGETRPGERILRGPIRVTTTRLLGLELP